MNTWIQPVVGHHPEKGTVCLLLRAMPYMTQVAHYDLTPGLAREMGRVLQDQADLADAAAGRVRGVSDPTEPLRIKVRRRPFEPFFHFECPVHPDKGTGTFQDVGFAADAARQHYVEEHSA